MNTGDLVRLALNSLTHRKLRTGLAVLGVVIGVVSIVGLSAISAGFQQTISSRFSQFGTNQLTITPGHSRAGGAGGFRPPDGGEITQAANLTLDDVRAVRTTPGVELVNSVVAGRTVVTFRGQKASLTLQGVDTSAWSQITTAQTASGRLLQAGDRDVAVVGNNLVTELFDPPVGLNQLITIGSHTVQVVGILQQGGGFGGGGGDSVVYVPQDLARDVFGTPATIVTSITAKAGLTANLTQIQADITTRLMASHHVTDPAKQDFTVTNPSQFATNAQSALQAVTIFLDIVGLIAPLVAAIMIANTMFTAVLERRKQIGVLKALGASSTEVMLAFLFESALIGLIGGIIGSVTGLLLASFLSSLGLRGVLPGGPRGGGAGAGGFQILITPQTIVLAIVGAVVVGAIAGVLPAMRAARLQPVQTLRSE